jgi:hypothetical protein
MYRNLTVGHIMCVGHSYVHEEELEEYIKGQKSGQVYRRNDAPLSFVRRGQVVKSIEAWGDPEDVTEEEIGITLDECAREGIYGPSNFGSVFLRKFKEEYPRCGSTFNRIFMKYKIRPWSVQLGERGAWKRCYQWDIRSAYASAALTGLPNHLESTSSLEDCDFILGVFELPEGPKYPKNSRCSGINKGILSREENEFYRPNWIRQDRFFRCREWTDFRPQFDWIRERFTCWKAILRGYWSVMYYGAAVNQYPIREGVETKTRNSSKGIPRPFVNMPAYHLIISRTHLKIFPYASLKGVERIWTDCIDTTDRAFRPSPVGEEIGMWKEVAPRIASKRKLA